MEKDKIPMTEERIKFLDTYGDLKKDNKILKEILFVQNLQLDKLEKIRSNTSKLVWWLVVIPIITFIIILIFRFFNY